MSSWPELDPARDHETFTVLHLAAQMLGKLRVAHSPWVNHGWHVALQPSASGFETLPTAAVDGRSVTLALDLCGHALTLAVSDGERDQIALQGHSVAAIHDGLIAMLQRHRLPADFNGTPSEIEGVAPFAMDDAPRSYSRDSAERLRAAFAGILPVFARFRAGFVGKASPVHFWWGAFDLAVSRFSGRSAPPHSGGMPGLPDRIAREAYSHEVFSGGFWAGGATAAAPFFYSYIYPEPEGFREAAIAHGRFDGMFGEFVLPYEEVRRAAYPGRMLTEFLQTAYAAAADLAGWDRLALERAPVAP